MLNRLTVLLFVALCVQTNLQGQEALALAAPISDHMVLQHGKRTSVWGAARPGDQVSVEFAGQSVSGDADASGNWSVALNPLSISAQPMTMKVATAGETLEVKDILVGEVWMCSGQSNMAFTLNRMTGIEPYKQVLSESNLPLIRFFNTASKTSESPQRNCEGEWKVMTPETAGECSAVGYFFGCELHAKLNVPIGLANTAWGGKPVEAFTSYAKLETVADAKPLLEEWQGISEQYDPEAAETQFQTALARWTEKSQAAAAAAKQAGQKRPKQGRKPTKQELPVLDSNHPGAIYNQKVAPWTNYAVAGAIWYQGESNRARAVQYQSLLTALIEDWRQKWNDPFPFYIVQLASYQAASTEPGVADAWAELQNSQTLVARTVPNCGIAVANDIGEANDIHPKNKLDVGKRLALLALQQTYGQAIDPSCSPLYKDHSIAGNQVTVRFDHLGEGLKSRDGAALQRFEIAGDDRVWHWADASITQSGDSVIVSSKKVDQPVAVRYAWAANPTGANLVNSAGLPASLFRTDDWPLSTAGVFTRLADDGRRQMEATQKSMAIRMTTARPKSSTARSI
jgi:sialate O-acetylesterase